MVQLSTEPPAGSTVIGVDARGPVAARRSPSPSWSADAQRPHFRPSDARHGSRGAFGALQHRTGQVLVETAATRDPAAWRPCLDGLEAFVPDGDLLLVVDGVPLHGSLDTLRWNWGHTHTRFHLVPLPKSAAGLNRIEGFCKILGQRALAGREWRSPEEVEQARHAGGAEWNQHPTPFLWGRPPKPHRHLKHASVYRI